MLKCLHELGLPRARSPRVVISVYQSHRRSFSCDRPTGTYTLLQKLFSCSITVQAPTFSCPEAVCVAHGLRSHDRALLQSVSRSAALVRSSGLGCLWLFLPAQRMRCCQPPPKRGTCAMQDQLQDHQPQWPVWFTGLSLRAPPQSFMPRHPLNFRSPKSTSHAWTPDFCKVSEAPGSRNHAVDTAKANLESSKSAAPSSCTSQATAATPGS